MAASRLTELQTRILVLLSGISPRWTLVGGGALAGFHLAHRETRDLDLFFRPLEGLGEIGDDARSILVGAGLEVAVIKRTRDFARLRVSSSGEVDLVDLVSEPADPPLPAEEASIGEVRIRIATRLELLASKLCTLMNRAEIRDLVDVRALLEAGVSLDEAEGVAPRIDSGFSSPTLAWVLEGLDAAKLARAEGSVPVDEIPALSSFKERLVEMLLAGSRPD